MKKGSKFRSGPVMPVLILTVICLVITAALAFTNHITAPIIKETERAVAEQGRKDVLPEADGFQLMDISGLPETVKEVYKATNGTGYVFMITSDGYGGADTMNLACGMDTDGKITAVKVLSHQETAGLGSQVAETKFTDQFIGKGSELDGVDVISGASRSSGYFINAIHDAFDAYEMAKGAD